MWDEGVGDVGRRGAYPQAVSQPVEGAGREGPGAVFVGQHGVGLERRLKAADDPFTRDGDGVVVDAVMAESGEVFRDRGAVHRLAEAGRPRGVEGVACGLGGVRKAGVVDVVVDDEGAEVVGEDPDTAVGKELAKAEAAEERIELALPDATGVAAPGHVPGDTQDVEAAMGVVVRVLVGVEVGEPGGDSCEEVSAAGLDGVGCAVVIRAADVDGGLVGANGRGDGGDEAVGDGGDAAGKGGNAAGGIRGVGDGNTKLVDNGGVSRVASGVEFADQDGDEVADGDAVGTDRAPGLLESCHGDDVPGVEALDNAQVFRDGLVPAVGGVEVGETARRGDRGGCRRGSGSGGGCVEDDGWWEACRGVGMGRWEVVGRQGGGVGVRRA